MINKTIKELSNLIQSITEDLSELGYSGIASSYIYKLENILKDFASNDSETNLFEAAKNYAEIVNERLTCKPLQRKNMERKYEHSLEQLGAASLEYAIAIKSYPYDSV